MSLAALGPIGAVVAGVAAPASSSVSPAARTTAAGAQASSGDFGASLAGAVDNLQQLQSTSNQLAVQAVTGNLDDIHNATIAATRAQVTLELASTVRNKAVDAFNEIMRMQG
ncbi:flagellar hook-basal body complex protein FliE [Sinomonas sp. G460-2]|uniref:flagellar hook-basal body complex protein FliE n=1 Tax=Sinomonas sp. G460-2 TaxID=3393464 RepID=UPI0039EF71C0